MKIILFIIGISWVGFATAQINVNVPWTWINGSTAPSSLANYGTRTVPSSSNKISARRGGKSWSDNAGNLWLFGGAGYDGAGSFGEMNDLWKYNISTNFWTWMKGDNTPNNYGLYLTPGVFNAANKPGGRDLAMTWTDNSGNFWMFGGYGYASTQTPGVGRMSDVWKYDLSTNNWAWIQGDTIQNTFGGYGTLGVPGSGSGPGGRERGATWTDASNNLWLFGGYGYSESNTGELNDLWKYNPSTNQWTWVKGDKIGNSAAVYGTQGTPANANKPGGLEDAVSWIDGSGNLWLFGGTFGGGSMNDLWKYNPGTNQWTWMRGDGAMDQSGIYGTIGVPSASNLPGSRYGACSWVDNTGILWMFGGVGFGPTTAGPALLNDLWKYEISTNMWTWVKGDNAIDKYGIYGSQGVPSLTNKPGGRNWFSSWKDNSGNLWLFGGRGNGASSFGLINDLWKIISPVTYTFVGGGAWTTNGNWQTGVAPPPIITQSMIIDIAGTGPCNYTGDITIQQFGTIGVRSGRTLNIISGHLNNSGYLYGPGKVIFSGGLTILNSPGIITTPLQLTAKQMYLTANANTEGIELTGGSTIRLDNFNLNMDTGTLVGNNTNFIITNGTGRLSRFVSVTPKTFHIGSTSSSYTPATLSNTGATSPSGINNNGPGDDFAVGVTDGVLNRSGSPAVTIGAINKTWLISEEIPSGSNVNLTLQWNTADEQPGFDRTRCAVAAVCPPPPGCVGGFDDNLSAAAAGSNPYTMSRNNITSFDAPDTFIVRTNPIRFTFTNTLSNGLWNSSGNWLNGLMPTPPIKNGWEVVIDPTSGSCIYTGNLLIEAGGLLKVQPGKILTVTGNLVQQ